MGVGVLIFDLSPSCHAKRYFVKTQLPKIIAPLHFNPLQCVVYIVWQYRLWSFQTGYIKLARFLHKSQHTQRKFWNFENWTNGEPQ